ncbi:MAG: zinc-dependent metalloprotease [Actinomycetes bacterium]
MSVSEGPTLIDWDLAAAIGHRLVRPGPVVGAPVARQAVEELREAAVQAQRHVRDASGLDVGTDRSTTDPMLVAVVDRPTWVRANASAMRALMDPLAARMLARRTTSVPGPVRAVGARLTGAEVGAALAFVAGKVLGQYELFAPDPGPGRLLLVAPNIVAAEESMGVDPTDFRLWVCLHEETHRVQLAGSPWLREHLLGEVGALVDSADVDLSAVLTRLRSGLAELRRSRRAAVRSELSLPELVASPAQRAILDRVTAVMSLLEGHADYVMDAVGPAVVPSVATIRQRFTARRSEGTGRADQLFRRLLGLDAKLRQYSDGGRFVRAVVDQVGITAFNRVWSGPETLPTLEELHHPGAWVTRVLPTQPAPAGQPT